MRCRRTPALKSFEPACEHPREHTWRPPAGWCQQRCIRSVLLRRRCPRRRPYRHRRILSSSMDLMDFLIRDGNMSPSLRRANRRRRPGSMLSPIPPSDSRWEPKVAAVPVGQQPGKPADAVVERSCDRSVGRGVLSSRQRDRRTLERRCVADPDRGRNICCTSWPWIQSIHTYGPGHRSRSGAIRAVGRSDQDLAPQASQSIGPRARPLCCGLCGMSSGPSRRVCGICRNGDRCCDRRNVRAKSLDRCFRIADRLR